MGDRTFYEIAKDTCVATPFSRIKKNEQNKDFYTQKISTLHKIAQRFLLS